MMALVVMVVDVIFSSSIIFDIYIIYLVIQKSEFS